MADGGEVGGFAAEEGEDLHRRTERSERVHFKNLERLHAGDPAVRVFLKLGIEDGTSFATIFGENVSLLHFLGPLLPRERRGVEGDMADEVEAVVLPAHLLGVFIEENTLGGEFVHNGLLFLGVVPDGEEGVEGGIGFPDGFAGVVLERFGDELAMLVEVLDALGSDPDPLRTAVAPEGNQLGAPQGARAVTPASTASGIAHGDSETGDTPGPGAVVGRSEAHQQAPMEQRMGGAERAPKGRRKTPAVTGGPHRTAYPN